MKSQGIIFDFNGVLWWDGHLQEKSWKRFSKEIRGTEFSEEELAFQVHGRNNKHTLEYLVGSPLNKDDLHLLIQKKETLYRELCLEQGANFRLSPGAIDLLNFLVEKNIPHTIATASEKSNIDFFVKHLRLQKWFQIERLVYDDGIRPGKPAPDIYIDAAARLELEPKDCIVVEDSLSGIQAAYDANIGHIIALGPPHSHERLKGLTGVDEVVESLGQITFDRFNFS